MKRTWLALTASIVLSCHLIISISVGLSSAAPASLEQCDIQLVESIPQNLTYGPDAPAFQSTYWAWKWLIQNTKRSLDIASFYWTLQSADLGSASYPSDWQGQDILKGLLALGEKGPYPVRIVAQYPSRVSKGSTDLKLLNATKHTSVRYSNYESVWGSGILHTKLWLVDRQHAYIGSANSDFRSLTQVKELGVLIRNCNTLVEDLAKIFEVYWYMGQPGAKLPSRWPQKYSTTFNSSHPMSVQVGKNPTQIYVGSSPAMLCPQGRTTDLQAILASIRQARRFIYVAVMDFLSLTVSYGKSGRKSTFWPIIVDALMTSAINNGTEIRILASHWDHTNPDMYRVMTSLRNMNNVQNSRIKVKLFTVPAYTPEQRHIPFGRVNHNKYMVTDNVAYVGTSNWSGDYFKYTGGVGFVSIPAIQKNNSLQGQLQSIFLRDWNSKYASDL